MNRDFFLNVNLRPPCKDCERRDPGCHDKCPDYISYKVKFETNKEAKLKYEESKSRHKYGLRRHDL